MNASLLVIWLQSSLLLGVAFLILKLCRRSVEGRVLICRVALVLTVALWFASPFVSRRASEAAPIQTISNEASAAPIAKVPIASQASKVESSAPATMGSEPTTTTTITPEAKPSLDLVRVGQASYGIGLSIAFISMGFGFLLLARLKRRANLVQSGVVYDCLRDICQRRGVSMPRLARSDHFMTPMVCGVLQPVILLPENWTDEADAATIEAVLEHEVTHIAEKDLLWLFLGRLVCSVMWCQPFAWLLYRDMRLAIEELCDRRVLEAGISSSRYAEVLVSLQEKRIGRLYLPALGVSGATSNFGRRIRSILDSTIGGRRMSRAAKRMIACAVALAAIASAVIIAQPARQGQFHAHDGIVQAVDPFGSPVDIARARLLMSNGLLEPGKLMDLPVSGNKVALSNIPAGWATGTIVVETVDGRSGFAMVWPVKDKLANVTIYNSTTIRGKVLLPIPNDGSIRIKTVAILRPADEKKHEPGAVLPIIVAPELSQSAPIDANGNFELPKQPNGCRISLQVDDDRIASDWDGLHVEIDADGHSKPVSYQAQLGGMIEGRVLRNGQPVSGMKIGAQRQNWDGWGDAITGPDGSYRIARLLPGTYNVAAEISAEEDPGFAFKARESIVVASGKAVRQVDLAATTGGLVSGVLVDASGRPIQDGTIGVYGPAHPRSSAWVGSVHTNEKGEFRYRVPAGKQYVYAMWPYDEGRTISVDDGKETKIRLAISGSKSRAFEGTTYPAQKATSTKTNPPITMKNGAKVEIVLLCRRNGKEIDVWQADGTRVKTGEGFDRALADRTARMKGGADNTFVVLSVSNFPAQQDTFRYKSSSMNGVGNYSDSPGVTQIWIPLGKKPKEIEDVQFGLAANAFKTFYEGKPNDKYRVSKSQTGSLRVTYDLPKSLLNKDLMLFASSKDRKETMVVAGGLGITRYVCDLKPSTVITKVKILARDIEWVTFKGVHAQL